MRRVAIGGVLLMLFGTVLDLTYHAIMEPDEIFPVDKPMELTNHLVIMAGVGLLLLAGILTALRDRD